MSTMEIARLSERVTKVETAVDTERPHLATRADLERQTRLIIMWFIGVALSLLGLIVATFLHLQSQLAAVLSNLP